MGHFNKALEYYLKALERYDKNEPFYFREVFRYFNISRSYLKLGDIKSSQSYLNTAIEIIQSIKHENNLVFRIDDLFFEISRVSDFPKQSIEYIDQSLKYAKKKSSKNNVNLIRYCNHFSEYLLEIGQIDSANNYLSKVLDDNKSYIESFNDLQSVKLKNALIESNYLKCLSKIKLYEQNKIEKFEILNEIDSLIIQVNTNLYKSQIDFLAISSISTKVYDLGLMFFLNSYLEKENYRIHYKAFSLAEETKSKIVLNSLNRNSALQQTNIPDTLQLKINSLKQQDSFLSSQINRLEKKKKLTAIDSSKLSDFKSVLLDKEREGN